jgi:hypothetical protein
VKSEIMNRNEMINVLSYAIIFIESRHRHHLPKTNYVNNSNPRHGCFIVFNIKPNENIKTVKI